MQPWFCSVQGSAGCDLRTRWELPLTTYSTVLSEILASEVDITNCYNLGDLTSMFLSILSQFGNQIWNQGSPSSQHYGKECRFWCSPSSCRAWQKALYPVNHLTGPRSILSITLNLSKLVILLNFCCLPKYPLWVISGFVTTWILWCHQ